ncbi:hypothetical protein [Ralstonia mannitolilytica]|uniref:hypothetical protein n=1 Tax=Ralstonia mannitolilytica TaxID=105219 RepID=UPI0007B00ED3|nr:hypothetical protein [Ralstonia mannitolilytica]ANA34310.1 hypothetical protein VZ52_13400 [Ralstonia mannitolilytica]
MHLTDQQAATRAADQQNELGALRAVLAASKAHLSAIANKRHAVLMLRSVTNFGVASEDLIRDVARATLNVDRAEAYLMDVINRAEATQ